MGIRGMGGERLDSLAQDVGVPYNIYIYIHIQFLWGGICGLPKTHASMGLLTLLVHVLLEHFVD